MHKSLELEPEYQIPTRREAIHSHVENFDDRDTHYAQHIATMITDTNRPLAEYLVLIPVAAHQEANQIPLALSQYAHQQSDQPFSVILGLNSPTTEQTNPAITATIQAIEAAKLRYPHLDVRSTLTFYDNPAIGAIRRDLWNGALLAAMDEGRYLYEDDELIGINHDIDTVSINPRYIKRVQDHYAGRRRAHANAGMSPVPFTPKATLLKHAPSEAHPNVTKGAYWMDFLSRQLNTSYEASVVLPFSHYAERGGFHADATTYETQHLFEVNTLKDNFIPGTTMQTSARRYIDRLQYGYANIWTNESFGAQDNCRTATDMPDISQTKLETIITDHSSIEHTISSISSVALAKYLMHDSLREFDRTEDTALNTILEMNDVISAKIKLVHSVLSRVIHSVELGRSAASLYKDLNYRQTMINYHLFGDDN